jgi:hypothetical protein
MKKLKLQPIMTEKEADNLIGAFLNESHIKHLISEDTEVYKENGDLLCVLKKNAVPKNILENARIPFRKSAMKSNNRGSASGDIDKLYKIGDKIDGRIIGKINGSKYIPILRIDTQEYHIVELLLFHNHILMSIAFVFLIFRV